MTAAQNYRYGVFKATGTRTNEDILTARRLVDSEEAEGSKTNHCPRNQESGGLVPDVLCLAMVRL